MSEHEYTQTLLAAHHMLQAAHGMRDEFREALDAISRADTLGPILHPTAYMERSGAMHEDREALQAVLKLAETGGAR